MGELQPLRIPQKDVDVDHETPKFRVARVVEKKNSGSELVLGLCWMDPDGEPVAWSADAETHEAYYVIRGRVRVRWDGRASGSEDLGPEDSFFFPPALEYSVENIGEDQAFLVWTLSPSPPDPPHS